MNMTTKRGGKNSYEFLYTVSRILMNFSNMLINPRVPMSFTRKNDVPCDDFSCKVVVYLRVVFVSLQILSVYQALDPFLQVSWFYRELQLLKEFSDQ